MKNIPTLRVIVRALRCSIRPVVPMALALAFPSIGTLRAADFQALEKTNSVPTSPQLRAQALGETTNPATQSFLFIGNSFTFRHELKDVFKALATEGFPGSYFISERITYGGRDMFRHFELFRSQDLLRLQTLSDDDLKHSIGEMTALAKSPAPAFYTEYWKNIDASAVRPWEEYEATNAAPQRARGKKLARKPSQWMGDRQTLAAAITNHERWMANRKDFPAAWNYVVLQSWQDVSTNPATGYLKYAAKFIEAAQQQNTKPILYITAPYSQNMAPVTEPIEKERALLEVRLAAALAKQTGALVVPVPLAVYRLQKNGTALTFRYKNDGHPNQCGAYLTACLFYAAVFGKSPEGLALSEVVETKIVDRSKPTSDPDGHPIKRVFTDAERRLMQRTAWETIEAFRRGEY